MVTRHQIEEFLDEQGIYALGGQHVEDTNYICPSERWVREIFPSLHEAAKNMLGINEWSEQEYDCDEFTRFCSSFAAIQHRKTAGRPKGVALVFGEFAYVKDVDGIGHKVNFTVVAGEDEKPKLLFFEPQNSTVVTISKKEIESCTASRF